jgi:predicted GIY-YIG superfamily endonuclease
MDSESEHQTGIVYRIKLLSGKIYIGKTTQALLDRLYQHATEALFAKPKTYKDEYLPFIPPYQNFRGKNSSIRRLINEHRDAEQLRKLPLKEQREWLTQELLKRTVVLVEVKLGGNIRFSPSDPFQDNYDGSNPLDRAERLHINEAWIENPKQLLNYAGLPKHFEMRHELFKAMNESIERLGNCWWSPEGKQYCLSDKWELDFDYEGGELTPEQQKLWDTTRQRLTEKNQRKFDRLSNEKKAEYQACPNQQKCTDMECDFGGKYRGIFSPEPTGEEVATAIAKQLAAKDKEIVKNNRRSGYYQKLAEIKKELKRLSSLSKDERRKLLS